MRGQTVRTFAIALVIAAGASGCSLVLDWELGPDASLGAEACGRHEPNNTFAEATALAINDPGPFAICLAGDHDFYRFNVPADGQVVTISVHHDLTRNPSTQDLDVFLYDAANTQLASSTTFSSSETITCPGTNPSCVPGVGLTTGDYVIEVLGATQFVYNEYQLQIVIAPP